MLKKYLIIITFCLNSTLMGMHSTNNATLSTFEEGLLKQNINRLGFSANTHLMKFIENSVQQNSLAASTLTKQLSNLKERYQQANITLKDLQDLQRDLEVFIHECKNSTIDYQRA